MCGHVVTVFHSVTLFHICLLLIVLMAIYRTLTRPHEMTKLFYSVASFYLIYAFWTYMATLICPQEADFKAITKFLIIPILVVSLLRLLLVSPRDSLRIFFIASIAYYVLSLMIGYVEYFTGWHLPTTNHLGTTGLYYDVNSYSVLLVMAALFIFAYCDHFITTKRRLMGFLPLVACLPLLVWNRCMTGLVVIVLAIIVHFMLKIRNRKVVVAILSSAAILFVTTVILLWDIVIPRLQIYALSLYSLYDSFGLGYGVNGDSYYMSLVNNYDITKGLTNAHSYLLQIPLTSGLVVFVLYCLIIARIMRSSASRGRNLFWIMPLLYLLLLFSPSSSLMLWTHYIFFCSYICYAVANNNDSTIMNCGHA